MSPTLVFTLAASTAPCPDLPVPPEERGVALGLFSMDPRYRYDRLIDEIADLGATHLSVVWVWWQTGIEATHMAPHPRWTATETQLAAAVRYGRARGLHVTVFPIVRLSEPEPGAWRGKLAPADEDRWWAAYHRYLLRAAAIAAGAGAHRLSVGSELLTREGQRQRWRRLIDRIRVRHPRLELMYSANWDHYQPVRFWDLVDVVGVTGYWEVGRGRPRRVDHLVAAWRSPLAELARFADAIERPVVITEVGYPSQRGALAFPWDETRERPVDLEEQRLGFEALARALGGAPAVRGVFIWNWFGFGGPEDGDYSPRGKPAEAVLRCWFGRGAGGEAGPAASRR